MDCPNRYNLIPENPESLKQGQSNIEANLQNNKARLLTIENLRQQATLITQVNAPGWMIPSHAYTQSRHCLNWRTGHRNDRLKIFKRPDSRETNTAGRASAFPRICFRKSWNGRETGRAQN